MIRQATPQSLTTLRPTSDADAPSVVGWRVAYDREIHGDDDTPDMRPQSQDHAMGLMQTGRLRLLEQNVTLVAMTAFTAALHLAEARETGVTSAVLFTTGTAAVRAYQSIGFIRIGDYSQVLSSEPVILGGPV